MKILMNARTRHATQTRSAQTRLGPSTAHAELRTGSAAALSPRNANRLTRTHARRDRTRAIRQVKIA